MRSPQDVFAEVRALMQSEHARADLFGELVQAFTYDYRLDEESLERFSEAFGGYLAGELDRRCHPTERVLELDVWMRKRYILLARLMCHLSVVHRPAKLNFARLEEYARWLAKHPVDHVTALTFLDMRQPHFKALVTRLADACAPDLTHFECVISSDATIDARTLDWLVDQIATRYSESLEFIRLSATFHEPRPQHAAITQRLAKLLPMMQALREVRHDMLGSARDLEVLLDALPAHVKRLHINLPAGEDDQILEVMANHRAVWGLDGLRCHGGSRELVDRLRALPSTQELERVELSHDLSRAGRYYTTSQYVPWEGKLSQEELAHKLASAARDVHMEAGELRVELLELGKHETLTYTGLHTLLWEDEHTPRKLPFLKRIEVHGAGVEAQELLWRQLPVSCPRLEEVIVHCAASRTLSTQEHALHAQIASEPVQLEARCALWRLSLTHIVYPESLDVLLRHGPQGFPMLEHLNLIFATSHHTQAQVQEMRALPWEMARSWEELACVSVRHHRAVSMSLASVLWAIFSSPERHERPVPFPHLKALVYDGASTVNTLNHQDFVRSIAYFAPHITWLSYILQGDAQTITLWHAVLGELESQHRLQALEGFSLYGSTTQHNWHLLSNREQEVSMLPLLRHHPTFLLWFVKELLKTYSLENMITSVAEELALESAHGARDAHDLMALIFAHLGVERPAYADMTRRHGGWFHLNAASLSALGEDP